MTPPPRSPVTTRVPHGRACHPCSPASPVIRANDAMPSPSGSRHRGAPVSRPGDWSPSHRLVSHATAPGRRATAVVVEADGVPLSGRRYVGVPGRIVAMGETRDVIGSALGRQYSGRLDAYIRLEVRTCRVLVSTRRLGPVPAAWCTRISQVTRKGQRVWTAPCFAARHS